MIGGESALSQQFCDESGLCRDTAPTVVQRTRFQARRRVYEIEPVSMLVDIVNFTRALFVVVLQRISAFKKVSRLKGNVVFPKSQCRFRWNAGDRASTLANQKHLFCCRGEEL